MKIHMRPPLPLPPAPLPKQPPPTFWPEMQAEELAIISKKQKARLEKLYSTGKKQKNLSEDADLEESKRHSNRTFDLVV